MNQDDLKQLVPQIRDWERDSNSEMTVHDWLSCVGSYDHAIGYIQLFWPDLIEHDGCIFVGSKPEEENYRSWLVSTKGNRKSVEAMINHVHIEDLFQVGQLEPTESQVRYIGTKLREMWLAKARKQYPERNIVVEFYHGSEEDLRAYEVTLFQAWES